MKKEKLFVLNVDNPSQKQKWNYKIYNIYWKASISWMNIVHQGFRLKCWEMTELLTFWLNHEIAQAYLRNYE